MKKTSFLAIIVASFALCNCQQQQNQTTTPAEPPVAPPPIKVTTEKSEVGNVVYGGNIAPTNVKGKTIVIIGEGYKDEYPFPKGNTNGKYPNGERIVRSDGFEDEPYCVYTKLSATKAVLKVRGLEFMADYELTFITQTEGTAKGKGSSEADEDGWKNDNIRFIIK